MNKTAIYGVIGAVVAIGIGVAVFSSMGGPGEPTDLMPDQDPLPSDVNEIIIVDVGVLLPATGDLASHGNENKLSLDLAVEDFNMYLEEQNADWRMNLVVEDTQSDPIIALEKVQSLNSKGIKYALGPESSAETRNIMSYADSNDMIILSPSSTSPALAVADNIFRFVPDDTKQGKVVAAMLEQNGIKVMVPIYRGDVWGDGLFESTKNSFEALGGVVAEGIRFNPEVTAFSTEAETLKKTIVMLHDEYAQDEIGVFVIGFDEVVHLFNSATEYEELRNVSWFGSDGNAGSSTLIEDPRSAQFATATGFIATQFAASDNTVFEMVRSDFEESTGRTPSNNYVYSSYDSLWVLGLSMDAVGFDSMDVKDQLPKTGLEYEGALGTVRLNEAGDLAIADYELWSVIDGAWEPTSRYNAATGMIVPYDNMMMEMSGDVTIVDVGVLLPATGDLASHGNENKISLDLAVEDFNMYLEEQNADWRMNLVVEDTQSDPILALEKVQSLNSKGIKYALGPESSAETRNIMSYADSNDMIILSPSSTSPALAVADNIFRFVPDDTKQGKVVAAMLEQNGIKVVVPIYRGDVWGDGLFESTKNSFEALGGVVAEGIRFNPEVTVFTTEADVLAKSVAGLQDEYAQDEIGVFVIGFDEVVHLFNSATEYPTLRNVSWFGSDGNAGSSTLIEDPRSAQFATATGFIATQFAASDNAVFEMVRSDFEESTGRTPSNNYVYSSYDSLWVLGLSMDAVGFDSMDVKDQLPKTGLEYEGALGTVRLNEAGDLAIADYELWSVIDGAWEPTSRYNAATGMIVPYDNMMMEMSGDVTIVDVGVLLPATGDLASHGNENKISLDLAVEDFNMYLEEQNADWRMNLVVEDTQSDPILALEKVQSLNSKGIKYALGPESSAETRNIMSYADSNDMIILSPSSTSPALAVADNIFRFVPDDTKQGKVVAAMLEQNGIKVVVPIYRGDVWGDGLFKSTKNSFEALGGVVAEGIRFNPEVTVFTTEADVLAKSVAGLQDEYAQDEIGVFVIGFDEVVHLFNSATEYEELRNVSWFGSDGNAGSSSLIEDPRSAQFATATGFIATQFAASDNAVFEMVRSDFEESTGRTPSNNYVYSSYDSLWVLGLSMDAVGFDSMDVKDQLPKTGLEYEGALGTVRLNEAGDLAIADYELWSVIDGAWEPTSRYNAATGMIVPYDNMMMEMSGDVTIVDVGVLLPATGDLASHGNENKISLDLAVEDFNMYLEEQNADWRMNLVVEDTQSDPILALEKVQSLNSKGIKYALGPESSAETRNIMSYADSNDMIILSPSSTSPALAVADNIFRFVPDDTKQGKVVAAMLEQNGIKVVVPIYRGDVWGDGLFKSTKNSFEALGGVVAEGIRFNPEVTVFTTEADVLAKSVAGLQDEYAQDEIGVFVIGFDEVVHLFNSATEYEELRNVSWFGSDGNAGSSSLIEDPRSAQFATATGFIATQFAASDNAVFEMVRSDFEESTGRTPSNNYVYSSYDSLWVLGLSMDAVGFDSMDVKDQLPKTGLEYEGALGTVRLNEAGDLAIADYELWSVIDGAWEPTSRYNAATGEIVGY